MAKNLSRACGLFGLVLAAAVGIAAAKMQTGYLARIGPVPLRFQAVEPNLPVSTLPPLPIVEVKVSSVNNASKSETPPPVSPSPVKVVPTNSIPPTIGVNSLLPDQAVTNSASAANDSVIVTPQMLVEFFKPLQGSNGVNVAVPVDFMPATPASPFPPSSATYKTP